MSRRQIYVRPRHEAAWQRAEADADRRGESLSRIVYELIVAAYPEPTTTDGKDATHAGSV